MEILLILILIVYNICLVIFLVCSRKSQDGHVMPDVAKTPKEPDIPMDIVGKSLFKIPEKVPAAFIPEPQASIEEEGEFIDDIAITFADEPEGQSSRLSNDEVEAAFVDIRISDVPQSYPDDEPEVEPEMRYASGASFEEIGAAFQALDNPMLSREQRSAAGVVFAELEGTMLLDEIAKKNPASYTKINDLMDALDDVLFSKMKDASIAYQDFDMRDFI